MPAKTKQPAPEDPGTARLAAIESRLDALEARQVKAWMRAPAGRVAADLLLALAVDAGRIDLARVKPLDEDERAQYGARVASQILNGLDLRPPRPRSETASAPKPTWPDPALALDFGAVEEDVRRVRDWREGRTEELDLRPNAPMRALLPDQWRSAQLHRLREAHVLKLPADHPDLRGNQMIKAAREAVHALVERVAGLEDEQVRALTDQEAYAIEEEVATHVDPSRGRTDDRSLTSTVLATSERTRRAAR